MLISNNNYQPANITVSPGTHVVWFNVGGNHTVTSDDAVFDSGTVGRNETYGRTFNAAGTFEYHCTIHGPDMSGAITVQ